MSESMYSMGPEAHPYVMFPRIAMERAAADVLAAILAWKRPGQVRLIVRDDQLAESLERLGKPHSRRFVQKGLKLLQDAGLLVRERLRNPSRWGAEIVRQITLTYRIAGSASKVKKAKALPVKNLVHPCAPGGAVSAPPGALSLLDPGEQEKENSAAAADAGGEAPSSSAAGGDGGPSTPVAPQDVRAVLAAAIAEGAAKAEGLAERVVSPRASVFAQPPREKPPRAPALTVEKLIELAEDGDRAAQAELNELHRRERARAARDALGRADPPGAAD